MNTQQESEFYASLNYIKRFVDNAGQYIPEGFSTQDQVIPLVAALISNIGSAVLTSEENSMDKIVFSKLAANELRDLAEMLDEEVFEVIRQ